jgi:ectoine hydroxylase-related dioxygenase (phytanoyl-CoA dioxygenase family)
MSIKNMLQQQYSRAQEEYWNKGYTVIRQVFSREQVQAWRAESERLWAIPGLLDDLNLRSEFRRNISDTYVLDRLDPVLDISAPLLDTVLNGNLMNILETILRGPVSLLKCKLIRKDPDTAGYAHHQDYLYWRWLNMLPDALCSVGIPLFPSNVESGSIELFPSYHKTLLASADGNPDADFNIAHIDQKTGEIPELEPGDVLLFHSLTPHRSGPNRSRHPRTLILPSYAVNAPSNLYKQYYTREVMRRRSEFVGFEHYEATLDVVSQRHLERWEETKIGQAH